MKRYFYIFKDNVIKNIIFDDNLIDYRLLNDYNIITIYFIDDSIPSINYNLINKQILNLDSYPKQVLRKIIKDEYLTDYIQDGGNCYKTRIENKCYVEDMFEVFTINSNISSNIINTNLKIINLFKTFNLNTESINIIFREDIVNTDKYNIYYVFGFGFPNTYDEFENYFFRYEYILQNIKNYIDDINCENICLFGHSSGGIMANYIAYKIILLNYNFNKIYIISSGTAGWIQNKEMKNIFETYYKGKYLCFGNVINHNYKYYLDSAIFNHNYFNINNNLYLQPYYSAT